MALNNSTRRSRSCVLRKVCTCIQHEMTRAPHVPRRYSLNRYMPAVLPMTLRQKVRNRVLASSTENEKLVQCCFTSTETIVTVRDGEPRTAASTFTQLLNSVRSLLLYVHRHHRDY